MRINPSYDADVNLIYFGSFEGRNAILFGEDERFVLNERLPRNASHMKIAPSQLVDVNHESVGEAHKDNT